jgi:hypothetical protein
MNVAANPDSMGRNCTRTARAQHVPKVMRLRRRHFLRGEFGVVVTAVTLFCVACCKSLTENNAHVNFEAR